MKKYIIILLSSLSILGLSGCLKDKPNVDFSTIKPVVEITTASTVSDNSLVAGLENFSAATLNLASDSVVTFDVNYASVNAPTSDVNVTVGADPNAVTTYNSRGGVQFVLMPDSVYHLSSNTGTIKAGSRIAMFTITFYPSKIDPSQSYLLPISVTNASGNTISGNFGTIYFHVIGNPLAGKYSVTGTRYNYIGTVSWTGPPAPIPPTYVATTNMALYSPKVALPDNQTTIEIPFANVGAGYNYIITLNPDNTISVDYTFDAIYSNIVTLVKTYDPATNTIHIVTHYNNAAGGAGNDRIIDETFVKQ